MKAKTERKWRRQQELERQALLEQQAKEAQIVKSQTNHTIAAFVVCLLLGPLFLIPTVIIIGLIGAGRASLTAPDSK